MRQPAWQPLLWPAPSMNFGTSCSDEETAEQGGVLMAGLVMTGSGTWADRVGAKGSAADQDLVKLHGNERGEATVRTLLGGAGAIGGRTVPSSSWALTGCW